MILYKKDYVKGRRDRKQKTIEVKLNELPTRPRPKYSTPKEQKKFIKSIETLIRSSLEYKTYIKFLKDNLDMNRCAVLKNIKSGDGKRYQIEIHHEPFTLFDIVETVINRRLDEGEDINALHVADEIMELHYEGHIGLIPLSVTMHELVHNGRIFIPLQYIYHKYDEFYKEYKDYMNPVLLDKIQAKVDLSLRAEGIVSDVLTPEFVNLKVDGFDFPKVPEEWKDILNPPETDESVDKIEATSTLVFE